VCIHISMHTYIHLCTHTCIAHAFYRSIPSVLFFSAARCSPASLPTQCNKMYVYMCVSIYVYIRHIHTHSFYVYTQALLLCTHASFECLCSTPQHIAVCCTTLHHTAPHCTSRHHTATHCNTTATHCNTLKHTCSPPDYCNTLQYNCNTLQHTETHFSPSRFVVTASRSFLLASSLCLCNTFATHLQHICNTLQHTATHCDTLRHTFFFPGPSLQPLAVSCLFLLCASDPLLPSPV